MNNENIASVNTQAYFTKDIQERLAEVTDKQMLELLKDLVNHPHWFAILRYVQQRLRVNEGGLYYTDPVKDPTTIARTQGIMLGLSDLQNAVITLVSEEESENEEA